jgi:hypothetical protein
MLQPGYTLRELLLLSRSTVPAQRTVALQTLACVIARARRREYNKGSIRYLVALGFRH